MKYLFSILLSLWLISLEAQESLTVLSDVNIVDVQSGDIKEGHHIIIQNGIIQSVVKKLGKKHQNAEIIPGGGKWVIPGLIDGHIHFFQSGGLYTRPDVIDLRPIMPYEKERQRVWMQKDDVMRRYLSIGVTDVCDVGGPLTNYKVRDYADSISESPNVYITGPLISTYQPAEFNIDDSPIIKVHSPEEARKLVQKQLPFKPDFIKIWFIVLRGQTIDMHLPIIKATIEESHKHGIPVAVHATQLETARAAVKAGADILVHSVDNREVDKEFVNLLVQNDVSYIPTLNVSNNYEKVLSQNLDLNAHEQAIANPAVLASLMDLQHLSKKNIPDWVKRLMATPFKPLAKMGTMGKNLKTMSEAGVNIVTGTDAGNIGTLHAASYRAELYAMEKAGLSPIEILQASTINGAKMLGNVDNAGSIEKGKVANMVLIDNNPLSSIEALTKVSKVIKNGKVFEPETLREQNPEEVVQAQLNAYNLGDIDAFLETYDPEVKIYNFPSQSIFDNREPMREGYGSFFKENPNLHCQILNRIVEGNKIIDQEHVTGLATGREIRATAIYTVEKGKIIEVRFLRP